MVTDVLLQINYTNSGVLQRYFFISCDIQSLDANIYAACTIVHCALVAWCKCKYIRTQYNMYISGKTEYVEIAEIARIGKEPIETNYISIYREYLLPPHPSYSGENIVSIFSGPPPSFARICMANW